MKIYKKIMNALAAVEKIVLVISTLLILVLTVGNVFSRKVIHRSWSFTEELVVAVFVLITLEVQTEFNEVKNHASCTDGYEGPEDPFRPV